MLFHTILFLVAIQNPFIIGIKREFTALSNPFHILFSGLKYKLMETIMCEKRNA